MRAIRWAILLIPLAICGGCLSRQIARDGTHLREAMLDIYTDQVMDNLIRARSNMPFVQMKYSNIQANDAQDLSVNGTIDQSFMRAVNLMTGVVTKSIT